MSDRGRLADIHSLGELFCACYDDVLPGLRAQTPARGSHLVPDRYQISQYSIIGIFGVSDRERLEEICGCYDEVFPGCARMCVFHANWTLVPGQTGHLFQTKLDTLGVTARG